MTDQIIKALEEKIKRLEAENELLRDQKNFITEEFWRLRDRIAYLTYQKPEGHCEWCAHAKKEVITVTDYERYYCTKQVAKDCYRPCEHWERAEEEKTK